MSLKIPARPLSLMIAAVVLLSACGHEQTRKAPVRGASTEVVKSAKPSSSRSLGQQVATVAVNQIGVPYRYGGSTVAGFDCSGLAQFAYSQAGKRIPRTTSQQWQSMTPVARDKLVVGDLLFFKIDGSISHVGLYLGQKRFVHAPSSGREVSIAHLDSPFYKRAFVRGGRPK